MIPSIRGRLERVAERFEEVTGLLALPQIQADQDRYRALSREYAQLEAVVRCYRDYAADIARVPADALRRFIRGFATFRDYYRDVIERMH